MGHDEVLASHFKRSEFACRCGCGYDTVDVSLLRMLVRIRDRLARPVLIHDGARCLVHNAEVGGAPHSFHLVAKAADISVRGLTPDELAEAVDPFVPGGLFLYDWGVHIDVGPHRRWDFRKES